MPKEEELCAITIFREVWKILHKAKDLEEAKKLFKEKMVELIIGETNGTD